MRQRQMNESMMATTAGCVLPGLQRSLQLNRAERRCDNFGGQGEPLILRGRYQVKSYVHRPNSFKYQQSI